MTANTLGHVRVTNIRGEGTQPEPDELVIYIDRSNPVLGNRHILRNKLDRDERRRVIEAYRKDLEEDFGWGGPMSQAVQAIAKKVMAGEEVCLHCWCAPLPCHGDVIADKVRQIIGI